MNTNLPATTDKPQSPPLWLEGCRVTDDLPVTKEEVRTLTANARRALEIAGPMELGRQIDALVLLYEHQKPKNFETEQIDGYLEYLADIPTDLLTHAMRRAAQTCSFWPKVADIRKAGDVDDELCKRSATLFKLEMLSARGRFKEPPRPPRTPEDIAAADAMIQKMKDVVNSAGSFRV